MDNVRIVIVDDQTEFRENLRTVLNLAGGLEVAGLAGNGKEALHLVERLRPNLVLMEVGMPVMDGLECTRLMKEWYPQVKVLLLSAIAIEEHIVEGLVYGAVGYLLKDMRLEELIASIRQAALGHMMLPVPVAAKLASRLHQVARQQEHLPCPVQRARFDMREELTGREKEVASLLVRGFTNKEIAGWFKMSEGTIRNCISVIYSKLGTSDRGKAIARLRDLLAERGGS